MFQHESYKSFITQKLSYLWLWIHLLKLMMHVGPAKSLFEKSYFENLMEALRPGGIHCSQGMCGHQQYYINCRRLDLVTYIDHACSLVPSLPDLFDVAREKCDIEKIREPVDEVWNRQVVSTSPLRI